MSAAHGGVTDHIMVVVYSPAVFTLLATYLLPSECRALASTCKAARANYQAADVAARQRDNTLFSFDVGMRHLAYALVEAVPVSPHALTLRYNLLHWQLVDLGTNEMWLAVPRICAHLDARWPERWEGYVGMVLLEKQMSAKMKATFFAMQMYFVKAQVPLSHLDSIDPRFKLQVYDGVLDDADAERMLKLKTRAKKNKALAVAHARCLLRGMPQATRRAAELEQYEKEEKADDVCDAMLQGFAYLKRRQRDCALAYTKAQRQRLKKRKASAPKHYGRIYPVKPPARTRRKT